MTPAVIPDSGQLSDSVRLEVSRHGGHVGFVSGGTPWRPQYFLPKRIIDFLDNGIAESGQHGRPLPGM